MIAFKNIVDLLIRLVVSLSRRNHTSVEGVVLPTRSDADDILLSLVALTKNNQSSTVADLCELMHVTPRYSDFRWGWKDFKGSRIVQKHGGYLLLLPTPVPLVKGQK